MQLENFIEATANSILKPAKGAAIETRRIGWGSVVRCGCSVGGAPLKIGERSYGAGWGDHAQSLLVLHLPSPGKRFKAWVGVQAGLPFHSLARFIVEDDAGRELARSPELRGDQAPFLLQADLNGATAIRLRSLDTALPADFPGIPPMANFNWCDPAVTLADGRKLAAPDFAAFEFRPAAAFVYDGGGEMTTARREVRQLAETSELTRWQMEETDADGTLTVRTTVTVYRDFPVIEWLPEVLNPGAQPSRIIDDFRSLSLRLALEDRSTGYLSHPYAFDCRFPQRDVALRRTVGSKNAQNDFTRETVWLRPRYPENHWRLDTDEGRSSAAWLPFFGVDVTETEGLNFGIGWSGAWYADLRHGDDQLLIEAGMPKTHFRVLPGECLRQPSIFIHHRQGMSVEDGQNQLRRFLLKYHSPRRADGSVMQTPLPRFAWGGQSSDGMMQIIDQKERYELPFDTFWVDAGWFGVDRPVSPTEYGASDWACTVGNWRVNRVPHPGGFLPVAEAIRRAGMKFLLWVEIERVMPETPVAAEHPEWLLTTPADDGNLLLNLGNEAACDWAIGEVERLVREEGIDYYRQDFNFNTIPFWADNDAPDRVGVTEMKYIAGLYRFWDTLRERFPDMLIDNCASGGRRIDFETNSRSICLFRSDMLGRPWYDCSEANHNEIPYLSEWVPLHAGGTTVISGDDYGVFSGVASGVNAGMGEVNDGFDFKWYREVLETAKRMMAYFYFDFHLLTPAPESRRNFYAYQCHAPEKGSGFFAVFRRPDGDETRRTLDLRNINPEKHYELECFRGEKVTVSGNELAEFPVELSEPRSMALYFYRKLDR